MHVSNGDARIAASVDGAGPSTVALIHGFPLSRAIWRAQVPRLARGARVVCVDLRGMGESSVPSGPYLMETLAADVASVLDTLGAQQVTVVGHSLGGYVALAFARMFTERVRGLMLVASRIAADDDERAARRFELADRVERGGTIAPVVEAYVPSLFAPQTLGARPDLLAEVRTIAGALDPWGAAAMLRGMALRDPSDDIAGDLDVPVTVLAGGADRSLSLEEAEATARAFPRGQLVRCGRSGHLPMLEEADAVNQAIESLVAASG